MKSYTIEQIVACIGEDYKTEGNATDIIVDNVSTPSESNIHSLIWIKPANNNSGIQETALAKVIICDHTMVCSAEILNEKFLIRVDNPKLAFIRVATALFTEKPLAGIHPSATVDKNAVIGENVYIGPNTIVGEAKIGNNTVISGNVYIGNKITIGNNVFINAGVVIGSEGFGYSRNNEGALEKFPHFGGVIIEDDVEIGANTCIDRGTLGNTIIKKGAKIDNLVHIAHNVIVGRNSLDEINVGEVLKEFGGGGHKVAASATLKEGTMFDVKEKLLTVLRQKTRPFLIASDIMSHPVLTIKPDVTVEEARKIMLRFNHSSLPVAEGNILRGMVSIAELDKAVQHKLHAAAVSGYMRKNVKTVSPDTALSDIQKLMIDEGVGKIPVINLNSAINGIVTRTDVLRSVNKDIFKDKVVQIEKKLENADPHLHNVKDLMEKRLPTKVHDLLLEIGRLADKEDCKVYVVGGFVRDLLLNIENLDMDIVVEGNGIAFASVLGKKLNAEIKKHKKFGTAVLYLPGGFKIDIATARVEFYEYPASSPTVEFSKIKYDLYRRDFTINAMAIELNHKDYGMLVDFFGAQKDLQERTIRVMHNMSFVEDPTRIFRAIRFEQRYGFKMEESTKNFMENALDLEMFDHLATHKMKDELVLILNEDLPLKAIDRMKGMDVLKYIHPDIKITSTKKAIFREITNSFTVEVLFLDAPVNRWLVNFLALVDDLSTEQVAHICEKFKITTGVIKQIIQIKEAEKDMLRLLEKTKMKNSEVFYLLKQVSCEGLLFYMSKSKSLRARQRIHLYLSALIRIKVDIAGDDLKAFGIKPGPLYKKIFSELLALKLDGIIKTRTEELDILKKYV